MNTIKSLTFAVMAVYGLASCNGPNAGYYTSPFVSADEFVDSLNYIDGAYSEVMLYEDETYRGAPDGSDDYFVIWDDAFGEYKSFSLNFLRTLEYYDYTRNTDALASEFRVFEDNDILTGRPYGDGFNYEVVDYDPFTDSYWGVESGAEYEDEIESTNVNLIAAKKEQKKFIKQASAISAEYKLNIQKSMSLVSLGYKVKQMKNKGDLSIQDLSVLSKDIEKMTGVAVADFVASVDDAAAKEKMLQQAADKLKTSSTNLEQKLLPELFGINL